VPNEWFILEMEYGKFKQMSANPNERTQLKLLVNWCVKHNAWASSSLTPHRRA